MQLFFISLEVRNIVELNIVELNIVELQVFA